MTLHARHSDVPALNVALRVVADELGRLLVLAQRLLEVLDAAERFQARSFAQVRLGVPVVVVDRFVAVFDRFVVAPEARERVRAVAVDLRVERLVVRVNEQTLGVLVDRFGHLPGLERVVRVLFAVLERADALDLLHELAVVRVRPQRLLQVLDGTWELALVV